MVPYEGCTFTGPYLEKENYFRICIKLPDGTHKKLSYHRYLMEMHIGRFLSKDEQIHHIDGNPMNNKISNLMIVTSGEHGRLHRLEKDAKEFQCYFCGKSFILDGEKLSQLRRNKRAIHGYVGPFCSRSCITKYRNYSNPETAKCGSCGTEFELKGLQLCRAKQKRRSNPNWRGPYCSKYCLSVDRRGH